MRKGSSRDTESQILVTDLLRREGQTPKAERRPKTALRVLGAAAGVAVLCGTVALGITYATYDDSPKTPLAAQQNLSGIIGGKALSPNAINAQTGQETGAEQPGGSGGQPGNQGSQGGNGGQGGQQGGAGTGGQGREGSQGGTGGGTGNGGSGGGQHGGGQQPGNPGGGGGQTGGGQQGGGQTSQPGAPSSSAAKPTSNVPRPTSAAPTSSKGGGGLLDPILDPILGFLTKATAQPEQAYAMLAPEVRTGGVEEFKAEWAGVESATVAQSRADGLDAAVVTVDYRWKDGRALRVEQRMTVEVLMRKITNAKVLSSKGL